jgi:dTDP-4-dehydrorhamnose reductase
VTGGRLLVTGLAGYLGRHVARAGAAAGWEVTGTVHATPAPDRAWRAPVLDVRDAAAVRGVLDAARPDVVIHTAYRMGDDERARSVNVGGAEVVAAAAAGLGARLVHLSTDVVFSGRLGRPLTEADAPDPTTGYGAGKAAAEEAVAAAHPAALLVRTSLLYGGELCGTHERAALAAARGERDMAFFTDETRCPIAVDDLAAALVELAAPHAAGAGLAGPLHVAGPDVLDRLAFARLIVAAHGSDPAALRGSEGGPGRPKACVLDSTRARGLLRTRLRGVAEALAG